MKTMFVFLAESETIVDLNNSQGSRKKLKKYLMVETKLFINSKTKNNFKYD